MIGTQTGALLLGLTAIAAAAEPPAALDAKAALDKLRTLVGTWEGEVPGQPPANVRYELTAGGTVVMETLFPGTAHEMRSLYHLDGSELVMTHYCAIGNQPRLRMVKANVDELVFDFAGGTNLDPAKDAHIHSGRIRFVGPDRVDGEWTSHQAGKPQEPMRFKLSRKK
jgi:hypothetical protein